MAKKLLTMVLIFCMLCMTAGAAGVAPGTTQVPAVPTDANLLLNETFETYTEADVVGEGTSTFQTQGSFATGGVKQVGNTKVLNVYSPQGAGYRSYNVPAAIYNLPAAVTTGYLVYEADMMLPNVAPAGAAKVPGGTASMVLNRYGIGDRCTAVDCTESHNDTGDANNHHRGMSDRVGVVLRADGISFFQGQKAAAANLFTVPFSVEADTWYTVKCVVDMTNGTYDVHVNSRLLITEIPFRMANDGIMGIGVGPYCPGSITVTEGYLLGDGSYAAADASQYGNPYPAYYDNIKLYSVNAATAVLHTQAGFEACFAADGVKENVTLPYSAHDTVAAGTGITQYGVSYSEECDAVELNTNATSVIHNYGKARTATVTRPAVGTADASGTITMNYVKGSTSFSHTVNVTVPAQSVYQEDVTPETGMDGYYIHETFEGLTEGANWSAIAAGTGAYLRDEASPTVVTEGGSKRVKMHHLETNLTNSAVSSAMRGMIANMPVPVEEGYLMLETDFMLPDVNPSADTSYAGGQAIISFGNYYGGNSTSEHSVVGEPNTYVKITGNRGEEKGTLEVIMALSSENGSGSWRTYPEIDIPADAWHNLTILLDMNNKQFDIYLNGKPVIMDCYLGAVGSLADYAIRSAVLMIPGKEEGTYPAGLTMGTGASTAADTTYYVNPFPVYFDNLKVSDVTQDYVLAKTEKGFKAIFGDGTIYDETIGLPYFGQTDAEDCYSSFSCDESLPIVITQKAADKDAAHANDKQYITVTRGQEDVSGKIYVTYTKFGTNKFEIPVTVKKVMKKIADYPGVETTGTVVFADTAEGVSASLLIVNSADTDFNAVMHICTYKNGELLDMVIRPVTAAAGQESTVSGTYAPVEGGTEVKAFVWVMPGMRPVGTGSHSMTE